MKIIFRYQTWRPTNSEWIAETWTITRGQMVNPWHQIPQGRPKPKTSLQIILDDNINILPV